MRSVFVTLLTPSAPDKSRRTVYVPRSRNLTTGWRSLLVPASPKSGIRTIVLSSSGRVRLAPLTNICRSGISATCNGMASNATVAMNNVLRPLKSIQANP